LPAVHGWGKRRKVPMGMNIVFELRRAERGDAQALERARFTLTQQRALIDPVWGHFPVLCREGLEGAALREVDEVSNARPGGLCAGFRPHPR